MTSVFTRIDSHLNLLTSEIIAFRRHLHEFPELSLFEFDTSAYIAKRLEAEGIAFRFGTGGRGLIANVGSEDSQCRVAIRADCDALPIQEENDFPHASRNSGVMHACGHDAHTAMLLGALIAIHRSEVPIAVRGIFQPAEEAGDGALGMIKDGALEKATSIIALHVDPNLSVGQAAVVAGAQSASCQDFTVTINGRGGHAARPHLTVDPVAIAASLIIQIHQSIPRGIDPRRPVVASICQIHAGHASNVIPDTATLGGTIRSLDNDSAVRAKEIIERICEGVGTIHGAHIDPRFERRIPGMLNDLEIASRCAEAACEVLGREAVVTTGEASMGAEDFADYQQKIPGCMMRLGTRYQGRPITPLHTPNFDIDERALAHGCRLLVRALLKLSEPSC